MITLSPSQYPGKSITLLHAMAGVVCSERKSDPTHETAPFFLYDTVKTATHSLSGYPERALSPNLLDPAL